MFLGTNLTLISDRIKINTCLVRMKIPKFDVSSPSTNKYRYKRETKQR